MQHFKISIISLGTVTAISAFILVTKLIPQFKEKKITFQYKYITVSKAQKKPSPTTVWPEIKK